MSNLIRDAKNGDEDAWRQLVATWTPRAYNFLRKLGAADVDAEEITQHGWFRALRRLDRLPIDWTDQRRILGFQRF